MKNIWILLGTLGCTTAIVVAVAFLFVRKSTAPAPVSDQNLVQATARLSKGNTQAPITIVEFSDLQCPACKAVQPLLQDLFSQASGSARLVFRHYPLESAHKNALLAAKASEAAANQGKFWQYHDMLYEKQTEWEGLSDPLDFFRTVAKDLGMNAETFDKDIQDPQIEERIRNDQKDGNALQISGTPTFFVNNRKVEINALFQEVGALLAK